MWKISVYRHENWTINITFYVNLKDYIWLIIVLESVISFYFDNSGVSVRKIDI